MEIDHDGLTPGGEVAEVPVTAAEAHPRPDEYAFASLQPERVDGQETSEERANGETDENSKIQKAQKLRQEVRAWMKLEDNPALPEMAPQVELAAAFVPRVRLIR